MIEEMQAEARALLSAGEYSHALAEFSVLREIRSRREGPYSPMYLSNVHDCVRCMSELELWSDSTFLCKELHGKYVRTHGRGQDDTVDVAKHWAWALVHLDDYPPAIRLYLLTADALWERDPDQARRLLGAAVVHRHDTDPIALVGPGLIDGVSLRHAHDVLSELNALDASLRDTADAGDATIDGYAIA
ncbi:hypothetical protein GCM10009624_30420 [Gordonia sinesedis]